MTTAQFSVLIVVPTLNERAQIDHVIETLLSGAPEDARLVVADGGSTDGTRERVETIAALTPRVQLVHNPARIQSAGINEAVRQAGDGAEYLLRADAHALYPADFCNALMAEAAEVGADSVTVPMDTLASCNFTIGVAAAQNSLLGTGGSAHRTAGGGKFVDHGHHALMRMDTFRAVGGYDEGQSHNEDAELDYRLQAVGGRIWLSGRVSIGYLPRKSFPALFRQYRAYGKGRAMTILKHRLRPKVRQMAPLVVAPAVALAVIGLVMGVFDARWLWLALPGTLWGAICLGYGLLLAARSGRAATAWAGPVAMVMHLGWSMGFIARVLSPGRQSQ